MSNQQAVFDMEIYRHRTLYSLQETWHVDGWKDTTIWSRNIYHRLSCHGFLPRLYPETAVAAWAIFGHAPIIRFYFSGISPHFSTSLRKSHQTTAGLIAIGGVLPRSSPSSVRSICTLDRLFFKHFGLYSLLTWRLAINVRSGVCRYKIHFEMRPLHSTQGMLLDGSVILRLPRNVSPFRQFPPPAKHAAKNLAPPNIGLRCLALTQTSTRRTGSPQRNTL
jgi:hypothetical protein